MWYNKAAGKLPGLNEFRQCLARLSVGYSSGQLAGDDESTGLLQPETRPITQEQLVNEVKGSMLD
jgi:hypothetical protein